MPNANTNEELDKLRGSVGRPAWTKVTEAFRKLWGEAEAD